MSIKKQYIPAPLASAVKGGYVTDTSEILDENKGKRQDEINQETDNEISGIKGGSTKSIADLSEDIANEAERASGVEAGLRESIDELGQIGLDPDNAISTNGDDFDGDTTAKRSKIPTIGAIIDGNPGVYDISKRNPTGGSNSDGKFTLEYILANANTLIPTSRRHGGMEICFVHSSDNKYVEYFLTKNTWSASEADWEKMNLEEEVSQLGQELNEKTFEYTQADSKRYDFKSGITYIIQYSISIATKLSTRNEPNGSTVELITDENVSGSGTIEFTPTLNAKYLRCGDRGAVLTVFIKRSIFDKLSDTNKVIYNIEHVINKSNFNYTTAGTKEYPFKSGITYIIEYYSLGTTKLSTRNTPGGATVEFITNTDISGTGRIEFTPTLDAKYLRCANSGDISVYQKGSVIDADEKIKGYSIAKYESKVLSGYTSSTINYVSESENTVQFTVYGIEKPMIVFYNSEQTELGRCFLRGGYAKIVTIPAGTSKMSISLNGITAISDIPYSLVLREITGVSRQIIDVNGYAKTKLDKNNLNLFNGEYLDNSCYDSNGNIASSVYWAIASPIDVLGHDGEKLYISNNYDATNRFSLFELSNGQKVVIPCTTEPITIPKGAKTAHITLYKTGANVSSLLMAQISFKKITEYHPNNEISGYLKQEETDKIVFPPSPQQDLHQTYPSIDSRYIYNRWDTLVSKFPNYITKEDMGLDASGTLHIYGYKVNFAKKPLFKIVWLCNQHGGSANGDAVMGALISAIMAEDLCGSKHRSNSFLNWLKYNVSINVMPCCNPWGIDNLSRTNYNGVNLNRNWPTSTWEGYPSGEGTADYKGSSAGSEAETQCMLSFINQVIPDVIIDNHTLGGTDGVADGNSGKFIIGQPKISEEHTSEYEKLINRYNSILTPEYGMTISHGYDSVETHAEPDARVWIAENNYYGGLIEMNWRDPLDEDKGFTGSIIEASYMLSLFIYQLYRILYYSL